MHIELSSNNTIPEERRQLELSRFLQQDLKNPETYNLNNLGALSKSDKRSLRIIFKAQEAIICWIHIWQEGYNGAPKDFIFHNYDSLKA